MTLTELPGRRGADHTTLRGHNLGLVAQSVASAQLPPSRAELSVSTGLTRATVSRLVDSLLEARILAELDPVHSLRAGRPAVPLVVAGGTLVGLGLEVNVDYLGGVLVDLAGNVLSDRVVVGDHRESDPAEVLGRLGALAGALTATARARGAHVVGGGLALPGLVDSGGAFLRVAPHLGWRDVAPLPLLNTDNWLASIGDLGLAVGNEADFAAVAEAALMTSVAREDRTFLYVSGEIGIGAAIVLEGQVFRGRHGWSGELGHVLVDPNGPMCRCGAVGCLEVYAGTSAVLQAAGLEDGGAALAGDRALADLRRAAEAGDPRAVAAIDRAGRALGSAIGDAINLLDLTTVILGNRYVDLAALLEPAMAETFTHRALSSQWAIPHIRPAAAGDLAALVGAARRATETVLADPSPWLRPST